MMSHITIRIASIQDAEELLKIYKPYVETTAISFEYIVPTIEEFRCRIENTLYKYPYLVAEKEGIIVGYAYANPFKGRAAYDWSVETTIYVKQEEKRQGIGYILYQELEQICKRQGILNMNACIASPREEDLHLTTDSIIFHEKLGYQYVGKFHQCGYKFQTWYDMIWMEKHIGSHDSNQSAVIWYSDLVK